MPRALVAARALALCLALGPAGSAAASGLKDDPEVAAQLELLDAWLRTQMAYAGPPGMVIGIVHDQELVWLEAYGWADAARKLPMRTDAVFRIASHSKLFTSVAAMRLRDAGRLQLDEPVQRQLPWFKLKNPESSEITLRHLLTHSAGVPREPATLHWVEHEFPTVDVVKAKLGEQEVAYPVETKWKYSNLGLTVVGLLVEKASGRTYADYVQAELLSPLGMASTWVGAPPPGERNRLAVGHGRRMPDGSREQLPFIDAHALDPATGVSSSVPDMLRFLSWQVRLRERGKTEILRASTLREMQRVHWLREDWKSGWGLGFQISHTPERDLVGHGGAYPGYSTLTLLSPKEKVGVVVFTNETSSTAPRRFSTKAFEWIAPALVKAAGGPPKAAPPDPAWQAYVGTYRSRWGDRRVLVLGGKLVTISPLDDDPLSGRLVLVPAGKHVFRIEGQGFESHGERARFELDASGRVKRLFLGNAYLTRVEEESTAAGPSM